MAESIGHMSIINDLRRHAINNTIVPVHLNKFFVMLHIYTSDVGNIHA